MGGRAIKRANPGVDNMMARTRRPWSLVSNHGAVVLVLANTPECSMREIADRLQITERQVARIIRDLREAGLVGAHRAGRRNSYYLVPGSTERRPSFEHIPLERFAALATEQPAEDPPDQAG